MAPRLIAVDGPLKGSLWHLGSEELPIGRDPSSTLCLDDPTVSRRHCVLGVSGDGWTITDLETRNGTFVNRLPVRHRVLENCDEVRIGASVFVFLTGDEETAALPAVEPAESGSATRSIVILPEKSLYLQSGKLAGALALGARHGQELKALLEISTTLPSIGDLPSIERRLMEWIFRTLPAERGWIFLAADGSREFVSAYGWERGLGPSKAPGLPRAEARRAFEERSGLLCELENGAASLVAAPLLSPAGALGVIALETGAPAAPFDADHLEWLTAVAVIAASAFESARRLEWLEAENRRLLAEINVCHSMVGESPRMREVFQQIAKAAPADSTVLVRGETGTGKELVARAMHAGSKRSARPFVAINCATLSEALLESEMFGHEKGAFTGAIAQKRGKIEVAEGGTLFLDEIGELAPLLQAKLLRVLQEREFERIGGTRPIRADIRLVAATNRDLEEATKAGSFRRDLYYRIHVITITVPPLRERREDIPLLASYFLSRFAEKTPRRIAGISPAARACLNLYDWPGNVRELENALERAVVLGSSELIAPEDLPETILERAWPAGVAGSRYHEAVSEAKRRLILTAMEEAQGSNQEAARRLGLNPTYLSRLIRNLNLKPAHRSAAAE
jgi:transcriptional regulator with GAF, ATPase, and Fis domain